MNTEPFIDIDVLSRAHYFIHYVGDEASSLESCISPLTYEGYKSWEEIITS